MMRRDMRRNQNDDNFDKKKILYITGAIFVLAIIIFAIVFICIINNGMGL